MGQSAQVYDFSQARDKKEQEQQQECMLQLFFLAAYTEPALEDIARVAAAQAKGRPAERAGYLTYDGWAPVHRTSYIGPIHTGPIRGDADIVDMGYVASFKPEQGQSLQEFEARAQERTVLKEIAQLVDAVYSP